MRARKVLWVPLFVVVVLLPAMALNALCERLVYDDNGVGGEDCGNVGPAFHQFLPGGEELAMFDCGMQTSDTRLVLVLLYAANSGHHNPVYAQRWEVPAAGSDEGSIEFPSGGRRCSVSVAFRDADLPHAHLGGEVCD